MARRAAMAKTPISARSKAERGIALLEAAMALAIVSLVAATAYAVFSQSAAISTRASDRLTALAAADTAIELASSPAFLTRALAEGRADLTGNNWQVVGDIYSEDGPENPLALIRLVATAGPETTPLVTLETLRTIPR